MRASITCKQKHYALTWDCEFFLNRSYLTVHSISWCGGGKTTNRVGPTRQVGRDSLSQISVRGYEWMTWRIRETLFYFWYDKWCHRYMVYLGARWGQVAPKCGVKCMKFVSLKCAITNKWETEKVNWIIQREKRKKVWSRWIIFLFIKIWVLFLFFIFFCFFPLLPFFWGKYKFVWLW